MPWQYDPREWSTAGTVAVASVHGGYSRSDDHVRGADFVDITTSPTIQFISSRVDE